jgi:predicted transcriptional regulator
MDPLNLSDGERRLLAVLAHHVRLPILSMLERDGELSAPQLADRTGEPYDVVYFALDKLVDARLIVKTRTDRGTQTRWFQVRRGGWTALREMLGGLGGA